MLPGVWHCSAITCSVQGAEAVLVVVTSVVAWVAWRCSAGTASSGQVGLVHRSRVLLLCCML